MFLIFISVYFKLISNSLEARIIGQLKYSLDHSEKEYFQHYLIT